MRTLFRNLMAIVVLIAVVYGVTNYSGTIQQKLGIRGVDTERGKGIAGQVLGDATNQVNNAAKHFDFTAFINNLPQDITTIKSFAQSQLSNVIKSRNKK